MFLPKLKLRRKKKAEPLTPEQMRLIVKEEIANYGEDSKKHDDEERHKKLLRQKYDKLSPHTKLRLLRYVTSKKGEKYGKK